MRATRQEGRREGSPESVPLDGAGYPEIGLLTRIRMHGRDTTDRISPSSGPGIGGRRRTKQGVTVWNTQEMTEQTTPRSHSTLRAASSQRPIVVGASWPAAAARARCCASGGADGMPSAITDVSRNSSTGGATDDMAAGKRKGAPVS